MNVVLNFHSGDQISARLVLELLMAVPEGVECTYYLQYGDAISTLRIEETILKFLNCKRSFFSNELPAIEFNPAFVSEDPNSKSYTGLHTKRTPAQKMRIMEWNKCVYKYIKKLDNFLMIEPDCVILKENWLKDIYTAWKESDLPIFGHLKQGKINGKTTPTHWAGCSVYNSVMLRDLQLEGSFSERYENPWWKFRELPETETANNCFWGPAFSGYDISYDYYLYAHWMKSKFGDDPTAWPILSQQSRPDLILCDFNSKLSPDAVISGYFGSLALIHGCKDDRVRQLALKKFKTKGFDLSAPRERSGYLTEEEKRNEIFLSIRDLKNRYRGQRCFIIGNGPSLRRTDLTLLKDEYTIGLNRIYLNYEQMGFQPTFHCVVNPHVIEQFTDDLNKLGSVCFTRKAAQELYGNQWNTFFMESLPGHSFNEDLESLGWYEGWTVTYCAMQLAYFLGFTEVILVGVDHYFPEHGEPNKLVVQTDADSNHFHPDYFGKGVAWQYPDLEKSEKSYKLAKAVFERDNRRVVDATVGGHLQVFPKVNYCELFSRKKKAKGSVRIPPLEARKALKSLKRFISPR